MGQMDFIPSSMLVAAFSKLSGNYFTDHSLHVHADQYPLFVHSTLIRKQWGHTQISVYIHVPFDRAVFIK